jgi:1,4-alpha-glucan branching enzyme
MGESTRRLQLRSAIGSPPERRVFTKATVFRLNAPKAHEVALVVRPAKGGSASTHPMRKAVDGVWHVTVELPRGRFLYRFTVDKVPTLDPASRGTVHDAHHGEFSTREIGH